MPIFFFSQPVIVLLKKNEYSKLFIPTTTKEQNKTKNAPTHFCVFVLPFLMFSKYVLKTSLLYDIGQQQKNIIEKSRFRALSMRSKDEVFDAFIRYCWSYSTLHRSD